MALKDFDDINPRTRDKNWKEDIPLAQLPKLDEYYGFRVLGGVFSYAQHWIEFTNREGQVKRYPVDCANWDPEEEETSRKGGCPCCELGLRPSIKYLMNVIDREAQESGGDPIRALDIPPTVMRQLVDLRKLNMVKGKPRSIASPKAGCDVYLMKQRSKKRGGIEWQVQKGDRTPLTDEELELELIQFDDYWLEPDTAKIRTDLQRHGYYGEDSSSDDEETTTSVPSKKSKKSKKASKKPKKAPEPDLDDEDDDEDDDFEPPKRRKASSAKKSSRPPVDSDDDDEDDGDGDDQPRPKRRVKKKVSKRPPPPADEDEDEDDDDFDDFDDDDDDF